MKIEKIKIADLINDPNNVRKHSQKNLDAIKGSLTKFGQQKPIVVDENNIVIAGNGTLEAAKAIGWDHLDCVVTTLKDYEKTAFALADNRTAELAEWDDEELNKSLQALHDLDFDLSSIGFDFEPNKNFAPGSEEDQGKLDEKKPVECPECGHVFSPT